MYIPNVLNARFIIAAARTIFSDDYVLLMEDPRDRNFVIGTWHVGDAECSSLYYTEDPYEALGTYCSLMGKRLRLTEPDGV